MIVYGHRSVTLNLPQILAVLSRRAGDAAAPRSRDTIVDLFVDFGEAYAAVADGVMPRVDDVCPALEPWSAVMALLGDAVCARHADDDDACGRSLRAAAVGLDALAPLAAQLAHVAAGVHEGFAYFALFPEQYVRAAEEFVRTLKPSAVTLLGLRGIGAPLAFLVASAAARAGIEVSVFSARPRGHPFARRLDLSAALLRRIASGAAGYAAVVDEGPGLSGSSFAAGVDAFLSAGFAQHRIVLFPSWRPRPAALKSGRARAVFETTRQFVTDFQHVFRDGDTVDYSGGLWRAAVYGRDHASWPAVNPQHERRKYRSPDGRIISRFAGFGRHGEALHRRAETLAATGFVAPPHGVDSGFLAETWLDGTPLDSNAGSLSAFLETVAAYIAFVGRTFATGRAAPTEDLVEMIRVNSEEAGIPVEFIRDRLDRVNLSVPGAEVAVDGRMLPHEWIQIGDRFVKTDALDHHADDFLPGCRDIAWDLAGTIVEFNLRASAAAVLVERYWRRSGDDSIRYRLRFYITAYAAYRLGYAAFAAASLAGTPDAVRFTTLQNRYRRSLVERARCPDRDP